MKSSKERGKPRFWVWGAILAVALVTILTLRQSEVFAAKRRLAELKSEIEYYRSMNETLEKQAQMLSSDEYIEKAAREKLGLVKPGEIQYMFVEDKPGA